MSRQGDRGATGVGVRDRGLAMEVLDRIGPPVVVGWIAIAIGLVLVVAGYWRVSGTSDVAQQLAYFASTCVGGLFALGVGGVLILSHHYRESTQATAEMRRALAHLAREAGLVGSGHQPDLEVDRGSAGSTVYRTPGSGTFHAGDCVFVEGRAGVVAMTLDEARAAGLAACQACDPGAGVAEPIVEPVVGRAQRRPDDRRSEPGGTGTVNARSARAASGSPPAPQGSPAQGRRTPAGTARRRPSRPQ